MNTTLSLQANTNSNQTLGKMKSFSKSNKTRKKKKERNVKIPLFSVDKNTPYWTLFYKIIETQLCGWQMSILDLEPKQPIKPLKIWFKNPQILWQYHSKAMTLNVYCGTEWLPQYLYKNIIYMVLQSISNNIIYQFNQGQ